MKDFRGTKLHIGDKVATIIRTSTSGAYLEEYTVKGACKRGGYKCLILESENPKWAWDKNKVAAEHKVAKI